MDFVDRDGRGSGASSCSAVPWAGAVGSPVTRLAGQRHSIDPVSDRKAAGSCLRLNL